MNKRQAKKKYDCSIVVMELLKYINKYKNTNEVKYVRFGKCLQLYIYAMSIQKERWKYMCRHKYELMKEIEKEVREFQGYMISNDRLRELEMVLTFEGGVILYE